MQREKEENYRTYKIKSTKEYILYSKYLTSYSSTINSLLIGAICIFFILEKNLLFQMVPVQEVTNKEDYVMFHSTFKLLSTQSLIKCS